MPELTGRDFPPFFEAVHGTPPFAWQARLLERVLDTGRWPKVIDLPTGVGKTAALDIACFALACSPELFPRRIVFVIDRRLVVDQVVVRGRRLAATLASPTSSAVEVVADRLRALAKGRTPLHVSGLRGGVVVDNAWARWPDQPCLIVSTVDQFGSRLLFRGYGLSDKMRPVHAGLAGSDCLVLLDEVHLSRPFAETLRSIAQRYRPAPQLPDRWQVVEMSATPGLEPGADVFRLAKTDFEPEIERRVRARKAAKLIEAGKAKQEGWEVLPTACEAALAGLSDAARTIGVVVNRVRSARAVSDHLRQSGRAVTTITGRMRPLDREDAISDLVARLDPDRARAADEPPHVIVATQCIEVGADFSFDALITECAPVDALRQRFGRLDRRGRLAEEGHLAEAVIIGVKKDVEATSDPVYGPALSATWKALYARHGGEVFDAGPLSDDLPDSDPYLVAPTAQAPLLLPSHLDAFVQTSPRLSVEPDPAPFLHGLESEPDSDVRFIWRADIPKEMFGGNRSVPRAIIDRLVHCPPRGEEAMAVPLSAARAWLARSDEVPVVDVDATMPGSVPAAVDERLALRWRGPDDIAVVAGGELRPGDTVVVPATYGGISRGNWDPSAEPAVSDLGDRAQLAGRRRVTLRLDPRVLPDGAPDPPSPPGEDEQFSEGAAVDDWLTAAAAWCEVPDAQAPPWFVDAVTRVQQRPRKAARLEDPATLVVTASYAGTEPAVDTELLDGSDGFNSFTGSGVTLRSHLEGVGATARRFAESLGLRDGVAADLELAGLLHDLGKADPRFQLLLHHGDEVSAVCAAEPLAKSLHDLPTARRASQGAYPRGMRHELLSVALADSCTDLLSTASDPDLVLFLIATHHGLCRPLPQVVSDPEPVQVDVSVHDHRFSASSQLVPASVGVASAERFWRVVERYGWYGTALLEAILRLADHRRSELEALAASPDTVGAAR